MNVPLGKPDLGEEELEAIKKVMIDGCAAGTCPEVHKFEKEFASFVGSKYAVATSSCTTALHLACLAIGTNEDYTAVIPSFTFPATGFAPRYSGAKVDIIDVEKDTFNMNPELLPKKDPDIIIPVHALGNPVDMSAIMDYADSTGAMVIEDSACGLPAYHKGKHTGTIGDIGCYSFYAIKNLCTGEGGMLVTDNEMLAEKARSLSDFGKTTSKPLPQFTKLGYNYRLSAIQAAMGRVQLRKLPEMHEKRLAVANLYTKFINSELNDLVKPQKINDNNISAYQRYTVVLDKIVNRDRVIEEMSKLGVQTAVGTYDLSSQPYFNEFKDKNPVSRMLFNQTISLPTFPGLTFQEIDYVCEIFKKCVISN